MARKQQGKSDDELSKELEKLDAKVNRLSLINSGQLINGWGPRTYKTFRLPRVGEINFDAPYLTISLASWYLEKLVSLGDTPLWKKKLAKKNGRGRRFSSTKKF